MSGILKQMLQGKRIEYSPTIKSQFTPRNIILVACGIANIIPDDCTKLKNEIMDYVNKDLVYMPPELLLGTHAWIHFEDIMKLNITTIDQPWKQQAIDIFTGKITINIV